MKPTELRSVLKCTILVVFFAIGDVEAIEPVSNETSRHNDLSQDRELTLSNACSDSSKLRRVDLYNYSCNYRSTYHVIVGDMQFAFPTKLFKGAFAGASLPSTEPWKREVELPNDACPAPVHVCGISLQTDDYIRAITDANATNDGWPHNSVSKQMNLEIITLNKKTPFDTIRSHWSKNLNKMPKQMTSNKNGPFGVINIINEPHRGIIPLNVEDGGSIYVFFIPQMKEHLVITCDHNPASKPLLGPNCKGWYPLDHNIMFSYDIFAKNYTEIDLFDHFKRANQFILSYKVPFNPHMPPASYQRKGDIQ